MKCLVEDIGSSSDLPFCILRGRLAEGTLTWYSINILDPQIGVVDATLAYDVP